MSKASKQPTAFELIGGEERLRARWTAFRSDGLGSRNSRASARCIRRRSTTRAITPYGSCAAGWAGRIITSARFGHLRLRARYLPFAIASGERDQWLRCMAWVMEDVGIDEALREHLLTSFFDTAD